MIKTNEFGLHSRFSALVTASSALRSATTALASESTALRWVNGVEVRG